MPACSLAWSRWRRAVGRGAGGAGLILGVSASASAHPAGEALTPARLWRTWTLEPAVVVLLLATAAIYAVGVVRLSRAPGRAAAVSRGEVAAFAAGWLALTVALVSPLDAAGGALFSAHMVQHELLMIVAAPLLVAGTPATTLVWAAPAMLRRLSAVTGGVARLMTAASEPMVAWVLHAAAIVAWHVPVLFDAAVHHDAVHALQHLSFFGTALLFWWGVLRRRNRRADYGVAVLSVFTTAVYTSAIGALLAIAPRIWYTAYADTPFGWGLSPLEDQQLGGLIMWVPGGIIYTAVGLWLFAAWLRESDARRNPRARRNVRRSPTATAAMVLPAVAAAAAWMSACGGGTAKAAAAMTGGDPERGRDAVVNYGCATCHVIPGVREARGMVGPPLTNIASRVYLAGRLPNSPANMERWIQQPHAVDLATAMPETGVTDADARDIAAYLYTLR